MIPINNSDLAWLVVSDFNQDNSIGYPDELREDVHSPEINNWCYEYYPSPKYVGSAHAEHVGGCLNSSNVGHIVGMRNRNNIVGGIGNSDLVGGNDSSNRQLSSHC